jgi:hypothetical protein
MKRTVRVRSRRLMAALLMSTALAGVAMAPPAFAQSRQQAYNAFARSGHTYCDAKLVGALWDMTPEQGKVEIGLKYLNRISENVAYVLAESRAIGHRCEWEDTGLSYRDAQIMASVWGLQSPYQAKMKAAMHYTNGDSYIVDNALGA